MKNADKPINPVMNSGGFATSFENIDGDDGGAIGLTKREYFAGLALQGLLSNPYFPTVATLEEFPKKAVSMAEALLKELETQLD